MRRFYGSREITPALRILIQQSALGRSVIGLTKPRRRCDVCVQRSDATGHGRRRVSHRGAELQLCAVRALRYRAEQELRAPDGRGQRGGCARTRCFVGDVPPRVGKREFRGDPAFRQANRLHQWPADWRYSGRRTGEALI